LEDNLEESKAPMINLPNKENHLHIFNNSTKTFDVLDLSTGTVVHAGTPMHIEPTVYTPVICDYICDLVREGKTLTHIATLPDMPSTSRIHAWQTMYPMFRERLLAARKQRAEAFADRALEVAEALPDKEMVPATKLLVDTLKWRAEKADPDSYGTKAVPSGAGGANISITLHTGVLDAQIPKDIMVDEFGNFKGFGVAEEHVEIVDAEIVTRPLDTNRFKETDDERQSDGIDQEAERAEAGGS